LRHFPQLGLAIEYGYPTFAFLHYFLRRLFLDRFFAAAREAFVAISLRRLALSFFARAAPPRFPNSDISSEI